MTQNFEFCPKKSNCSVAAKTQSSPIFCLKFDKFCEHQKVILVQGRAISLNAARKSVSVEITVRSLYPKPCPISYCRNKIKITGSTIELHLEKDEI